MAYDWPGNVRELENAIERAVILSRGNPIGLEHLPFGSVRAPRPGRQTDAGERAGTDGATDNGTDGAAAAATAVAERAPEEEESADIGELGEGPLKTRVAALEKRLILEALERAGGNRTRAAEELGIYRRLLYAKMREYGLGE